MLKVTVTKPFKGCPDGSPLVREYEPGDVVEGELAQAALNMEVGEELAEKPARKPRAKKDAEA